jgi:signal transduction histidine kinase/phage shock protein PspC (stress-responsive transcriptional regulator)
MATDTPPATRVVRIPRREDGKVIGGVCTGLGAFFGLDPNLLRVAFAVCSLAGGLGVLAYGTAWLLMSAPEVPEPPPRRAPDGVQAAALAVVVFGSLLFARATGFWLGDVIVWPLAAAALGVALLWMRPIREEDARDPVTWPVLDRLPPAVSQAVEVLVGTRRGAFVRVAGGLLLMAGGMVVLVASAGSWSALRAGVSAAAVMVTGLLLIIGPGLVRLTTALVQERRERIVSEERADMAAHLHDSVLQTLALVQRRADDPREVVRLARLQERELRDWLLRGRAPGGDGDGTADGNGSFGAALEHAAAVIEAEYGVPIEVVRVRDCPTAGLEPLLLAAREGMLNAARHSGAPNVSVYLEVHADDVVVFVRDRGRGFDPEAVAEDRGGIAASIVGRLARNGGVARIDTAPGAGCELELSLRRQRSDRPETERGTDQDASPARGPADG